MINNRQAGRRRGRGGQQQRPQGGSGRPDNGNRIDNRARGNAAQLLEKYKTLARDAQMQGDRVNVEYYLQFADHYFRVLAETRARFEENGGAPSTRRIQGATLDEDDQDCEDEGERIEQPQSPQPDHAREQNRGDQNRGQNRDQQRGDQQRNGQNGYRQDGRQDRDRGDGNRGYNQNRQDGAQSNGNQQYEQRGNGQDQRERVNGEGEGGFDRQAETAREDRPARPPRFERPRVEPREDAREDAVASVAEIPQQAEIAAEAPRRGRGRPRRDAAPAVESGLGDVGFMAERLAPSLTAPLAPEAANDGESEAEKPRRRRGRPPASETTVVG